jgi:hypothetical protein
MPPHGAASGTVSGVSSTSIRLPTPLGRIRRVSMPIDELKTRRFAGDFTHLAPILLGGDRLPSPIPNYDKDLPRIPSTSTRLWGDEVVTIFTNLSGDLTTSAAVGSPLPVPSYDVCERVSITEAQKIAAQYRQRHRSSSGAHQGIATFERSTLGMCSHPLYAPSPSTVIESGVSVDGQATNAAIGASSASQPPIIRALVEGVEAVHQAVSPFGQVHKDGTVSCTREDCLKDLPSLNAFLSHLHVHLIHEGYVLRLRPAWI